MLDKNDSAIYLDKGKIYRGQIVGREDLKGLDHRTFENSDVEHVRSSGICISDCYFVPMNKVKSRGGNYFHFLFHEMQRFLSYKKGKETLTLIDNMSNMQKSLIDFFFGLDNINLVKPIGYASIDFEKIRVGSYENINCIPNRLLDFYEEYIKIHSGNKNLDYSKLFIRRKDSKETARPDNVFTNVEEIEDIYLRRGFKTIYFEELNVADKIKLLNSNIDEIVTPIGSELANLLFMSKKQKVDITVIDHEHWRFRTESRTGSLVASKSNNISVLTADCVELNEYNKQNSSFRLNPKKIR